MKVSKIETIRLERHPNLVWVVVHTDAGLTGLGETWFGAGPVEADIHERVAPLLLGEDPSRIEHFNRVLKSYAGFSGTGAEMRAASAVDVALWDLAGKEANKPIHDMLGGKTRSFIKVYNTCAGPDYVSQSADVRPGNFGLPDVIQKDYQDLDAFQNRADELAAELLAMGIQSMKIWPFDFAEGAADGIDISTKDLKKALEPFEKIRAAHGDAMRIKAELHGLWSLPAAKKIVAALEPIGADWIEDPIWMDRMPEVGELVQATNQPIAGGETLGGLGQMRDLLTPGAISVPIIDITWGGGITFAKKAAALAEGFAKPIAFHDCSGPVTLAASTHLALACPNVAEQEITRGFYYGWYHELVDQPPPIEKGFIRTPDGAGLGLALLPDLVESAGTKVRFSNNSR